MQAMQAPATNKPVINISLARELVEAVEARGFYFSPDPDSLCGWMLETPVSDPVNPNKDPLFAELVEHSVDVGRYLIAREVHISHLHVLPPPERMH